MKRENKYKVRLINNNYYYVYIYSQLSIYRKPLYTRYISIISLVIYNHMYYHYVNQNLRTSISQENIFTFPLI